MIVEGLVPDPRRPGSTRVFVEGRPVWTVPADVVAELGLQTGMPLRGGVVDRLDAAAEEEGAVRAAMRAVERRAHGERELAAKLERKGHSPAAIAAAVARLRTLGVLDDAVFARNYVASRGERGRGPVRLRHDLARLGLAREVIERTLGELTAAIDDPLEQPRSLIAKRIRSLASLPADTRRRRLLAYLGRRGYQGAEVHALVERAVRGGAGGESR